MKKKIFSLLIVILLVAGAITIAMLKIPMKDLIKEADEDSASAIKTVYDKETVYFWYSDDTLTNYINSAAVEYNEANDTRVMPVLQEPVDYLETINKTTVESNVPDMYLISHDTLGKAYMAGLADSISLADDKFDYLYVGQARNSVRYKDKLLGYPLNFESSAMLYNETYLADMARNALYEEQLQKDDQDNLIYLDIEEEQRIKESFTDEEVANKIQDIIPTTIEELRSLGDSFDAPENVESFFTWDVTDIFYNFFFLGDVISVGGDAGWDTNDIDIYNIDAIRALEAYQGLNQFFAIDTAECEYNDVIQDFLDGKVVFTIATSDVIAKLEAAKIAAAKKDAAIEEAKLHEEMNKPEEVVDENYDPEVYVAKEEDLSYDASEENQDNNLEDEEAEFRYEYGVALIPDMTEEIETRTMSITNCVVINPYSAKKDIANDFARFLTSDYAGNLYSKSGKVSVASNVNYEFGGLGIFAMEYGYSVPLPKMIQTSNLWVRLEALFADVWNGEDTNESLKQLAEQMMYQVTGQKQELEYIDSSQETEEVEYYDEDELMREAQAENERDNSEENEDDNTDE